MRSENFTPNEASLDTIVFHLKGKFKKVINSTNKCNFDGRIVWLIISVQERQNSSIRSKGNNNNNCSPSKDQIDKSFNKERKYVKIMNNTSYFTIIFNFM